MKSANLQRGTDDEPTSFVRRVVRDLIWLWAGVAACTALLRLFAHDANLILLLANSFTFYLYLPAYLVAAVLIWQRRWRLCGACLLLIACHAVWVFPDFYAAPSSRGAEGGQRLRVFSTNLYMTNDEPSGILDEIRQSEADLLLFQEYSPQWHRAMQDAGITSDYPHQIMRIRDDSFGVAIYSRFAFTEELIWRTGEIPIAEVTVALDEVKLHVINWHPLPPRSFEYFRVLKRQYADLNARVAGIRGPLLVMGDFNLTQHAYWMKRLESQGLVSAHESAGRGYAVTYPNGTSRVPPIRLDHAMMSKGVDCRQIREGIGRGSDHKPLVAEFAIRADGE
jgi:endonuclease/exonuclease/phosphatase (EEP) superfamily protein YafD